MLTYGVVVSGERLKRWQLQCVESLRQSRLADLRCVINDHQTSCVDSGRLASLYSTFVSCELLDAGKLLNAYPGISWHELDASLRPFPASPPLDFLLLFGDRKAAETLTHDARYGVWYFGQSDLTRFTTAAPAFWEVRESHDVTGAFMLQMNGDGAGVPLKSAFLPTRRDSFEANLEALLGTCQKWPLHVCWDITHGAAQYFESAPLAQPSEHRGPPAAFDVAALRFNEWRSRTSAALRLNCSSIEWRIARVKASPADFIGSDRSPQVSYFYPREKSRYFADPCILARDSQAYLFCEEYRTKTNTGAVAVSELGSNGCFAPQTAIEEAHHLSYPHVFEHDGVTYCIPESRIGKVCLYRCTEFPAKWEYIHTLIDGFEAADSTLLRYGNRWWLFCTSASNAPRGNYSHLYIWHADDLFGTWTPHVRNPVKIDARSARPAGAFFTHEGALYRPTQDCSRSYGGAVRINRIDSLSQTDFSETVVGVIRPPRSGYSRGLHTIASAGDWCLVDVERYAFSPENVILAIRAAIRAVLTSLGVPEHFVAMLSRSKASSVRTRVSAGENGAVSAFAQQIRDVQVGTVSVDE